MKAHLRRLVIVGLVLAAWPAMADQQMVRIELTYETANPNLEYMLEMGTVLRNGSPTDDMAICLSRAEVRNDGLVRERKGMLVAYVKANRKYIEVIAGANERCVGPDCDEILFKVNDHNVEIDPSPLKRICTDPAGIGKEFGFIEIQLGELRPTIKGPLDIAVLNTYDDSTMLFSVESHGLRQTCNVPTSDIDVRYGKNWFADIWGPSPWMPGYSLFVCSEGVRVCSFSYEFMANEFHQAVIVANDQHNTVIHASNARGYFGGHECGLARDAHGGAIGRYFIEGWDRGWQIGLRIDALDGNDWVLGSPEPDLLMGGDGDDLLRGMAGRSNRMYGEDGHDIMHDSTTGACDGGSPAIDTHCAVDPWDWPNPYPAGDCCCAGCGPPVSCVFSDLTPGVADVPPDPW